MPLLVILVQCTHPTPIGDPLSAVMKFHTLKHLFNIVNIGVYSEMKNYDKCHQKSIFDHF